MRIGKFVIGHINSVKQEVFEDLKKYHEAEIYKLVDAIDNFLEERLEFEMAELKEDINNKFGIKWIIITNLLHKT